MRRRYLLSLIILLFTILLLVYLWFAVLRFTPEHLRGKPLPPLVFRDTEGRERRLSEWEQEPAFFVVFVRRGSPPSRALRAFLEQNPPRIPVVVLYVERALAAQPQNLPRWSGDFVVGVPIPLTQLRAYEVVIVPTLLLVERGLVTEVWQGWRQPMRALILRFVERGE